MCRVVRPLAGKEHGLEGKVIWAQNRAWGSGCAVENGE